MRRTHRWIAASLVAAAGCSGSGENPNEAKFPGAPGSSVPAPAGQPSSGSGASPKGLTDDLPSNYPGMDKKQKDASKDAPKETPKGAAKEVLDNAPKDALKDVPKDTPKEAPSPAKATDAPKDQPADPKPAPKDTPK